MRLLFFVVVRALQKLRGLLGCGLWEFGDKNFVRGRPELMEEMHKRISFDGFQNLRI